jgi:hypothetical protein
MTAADDIRFHNERAQAERDCAAGAATVPAARAHLALAELHLERVRALRETLLTPLQSAS